MKLRLYGPNIIPTNPGFELGTTTGWPLAVTSSAQATLGVSTASPYAGNYSGLTNTTSAGSALGDIQLYRSYLNLPLGVLAAVQFAGKADAERQLTVAYMLGLTPWTSYLYTVCSLGTDWQLFDYNFTLVTDVTTGRITFYAGSGTAAVDFNLDDINLRNYIELPVTYAYERAEVLTRHDARGAAGALQTYIEPNAYGRFTLPLVHVNSAERSLINSWWATGSVLRLVEDATYPHSWRAVRITGAEEPLTKFTRPYNNEYEGELVLETV